MTKKLFIFLTFCMLFGSTAAIAKIPGKSYAPGDTMHVDGIIATVVSVDNTGLRGKVISPYARTPKKMEKEKKKIIKFIEKEIKKGKATQEDLDNAISYYQGAEQIPVLYTTKKGIFCIEDWYKEVPDGWRLPNEDDASDFAKLFCNGIGKEYNIGFNILKKIQDLVIDSFARQNFANLVLFGFYVEKPSFGYLKRWERAFPTIRTWFQIDKKGNGVQLTVAFKDF